MGQTGCDCPECGATFETERRMKIHSGQVHKSRTEKVCETCGETFDVPPHIHERGNNRFCSHQCRADWQADAFQGDGGPGWKGGKEVYECRECGDTVEDWPSQRRTPFCNHECYFKWIRENAPEGEEHPSYRDGIRAYGRGWKRRCRRVRERDGNECQECGLTNEEHINELDASLHVHHIQPLRTFENEAEANRTENLVTLCAYCHMSREADIWGEGESPPAPSPDTSQSTFDAWSSTGAE